MPKVVSRIPRYRRHSSQNCGFVELHGRKSYFPGKFGSAESKKAYRRFVLEWEANDGQPTAPPASDITVVELLGRFKLFAKRHYVKNGRQTDELHCIEQAITPLRDRYGYLPAVEFGPKKLATVRERMVKNGWARTTINQHCSRLRRIFRWGVAEELLPSSVWESLKALQGLQRGRTASREPEPVGPVDLATVEATLAKLPAIPGDMVRLQLASGMRPHEVCDVRPCDVDRSRLYLGR